MNIRLIAAAIFAGVLGVECMAQKTPKKSSKPQNWDATLIQVRSSADGTMQPCWYWAPEAASTSAVPLIVGLHTWSGDYKQLNHYQTVQKEAQLSRVIDDSGPLLESLPFSGAKRLGDLGFQLPRLHLPALSIHYTSLPPTFTHLLTTAL